MADQLGHLLWMSLLAVVLMLAGAAPGLALLVMGVELTSFNLHQARHHPNDGWLRHHLWFDLGVILSIAAIVLMSRALLDIRLVCVVAGSQFFSYAIHRLIHEDWHWMHAACVIVASAGLCPTAILI